MRCHERTEQQLCAHAAQLLAAADTAAAHAHCLHDTVDKRKSVALSILEDVFNYFFFKLDMSMGKKLVLSAVRLHCLHDILDKSQ